VGCNEQKIRPHKRASPACTAANAGPDASSRLGEADAALAANAISFAFVFMPLFQRSYRSLSVSQRNN